MIAGLTILILVPVVMGSHLSHHITPNCNIAGLWQTDRDYFFEASCTGRKLKMTCCFGNRFITGMGVCNDFKARVKTKEYKPMMVTLTCHNEKLYIEGLHRLMGQRNLVLSRIHSGDIPTLQTYPSCPIQFHEYSVNETKNHAESIDSQDKIKPSRDKTLEKNDSGNQENDKVDQGGNDKDNATTVDSVHTGTLSQSPLGSEGRWPPFTTTLTIGGIEMICNCYVVEEPPSPAP